MESICILHDSCIGHRYLKGAYFFKTASLGYNDFLTFALAGIPNAFLNQLDELLDCISPIDIRYNIT